MDRKQATRKTRGKQPKQSFAPIPRQLPTDTMTLRTSWTLAAISSGTSGQISSSVSASIQNSSEYSVLASLWREVKLVACDVKFFFYYPYVNSGTNQATSLLICGTDMRMNGTTFTPPTQYIDVINLSDRQLFCRTNPNLINIRRTVPRNLEYTNIAEDCPTLPIPYAGSPGVLQIYGDGAVVSGVQTTQLVVTCTYMLRGRV